MNVLSVTHLTKSYGVDAILKDVSFLLRTGDRVGLIGRNGAGKTTLFRILTGQLDPDGGQLWIHGGFRTGYLRQETDAPPTQSLMAFCLEVFTPLIQAEEALHHMEEAIGAADHAEEGFNTLLDQYHSAVEAFEAQGGYTFRSRTRGILRGLGFSEEEIERPVSSLSGGQFTRLSIARLLLSEPEILLLDEPTNHLDIAAVQWLENYLKQYRGTLLLITHDRYFLDQVTNRIIEIEHGKSLLHEGNYSSFQEFKRKNREIQQRAFEKQEAELERQEDVIRRFRQHGTEKLAKRARSREKRLEHIERLEAADRETDTFELRFEVSSPSGQDVLQIRDLAFGYETRRLFGDVTFDIFRGERVGVIGPNGIGKTTLFRLLTGELKPWSGSVHPGHRVCFGTYDQRLEFPDPSLNLLQELGNHRPDLSDTRLRTLLGAFLFTADDVFKPIHALSGGERARLSLLELLLGTSNTLLMDEPTNHLDIPAREALEDALCDYEGTLLVISHDRYFLNRVCTRILDLQADGIQEYLGNYSYYLAKTAESRQGTEDTAAEVLTKTQQKEQKRKEKDQEREKRNHRKQMQELEERIHLLEERIQALNAELCREEVYSSPENSRAVQHTLEAVKRELDEVYLEWTTGMETEF